jgi:hypothetical protein
MDNLFLKTPKFRENPSIRNIDVKNETFYIVENDGYTDYLEFNKSFWYIVPDTKYIKVRSLLNNSRYYNNTISEAEKMKYENITPNLDQCRKLNFSETIFSWVTVTDFISGSETEPFVMNTETAKENKVNFLSSAPLVHELLNHPKFKNDYVIRKYNESYFLYNTSTEDLSIWEDKKLINLLTDYILKP